MLLDPKFAPYTYSHIHISHTHFFLIEAVTGRPCVHRAEQKEWIFATIALWKCVLMERCCWPEPPVLLVEESYFHCLQEPASWGSRRLCWWSVSVQARPWMNAWQNWERTQCLMGCVRHLTSSLLVLKEMCPREILDGRRVQRTGRTKRPWRFLGICFYHLLSFIIPSMYNLQCFVLVPWGWLESNQNPENSTLSLWMLLAKQGCPALCWRCQIPATNATSCSLLGLCYPADAKIGKQLEI